MKQHFSKIIMLCTNLGIVLILANQSNLQAQSDERCFSETSFCISGRIRQFWEEHGGLPIFGFPITSQQEEMVEDKLFQVQWFQRNRLELHPENPRPYDVLVGRLGAARLLQQDRNWQDFPKSAPRINCR